MFGIINPIPCDHIRTYYEYKWKNHKCIAWKLLWQGYYECSIGRIQIGFNNLFTIHQFKPDYPNKPIGWTDTQWFDYQSRL